MPGTYSAGMLHVRPEAIAAVRAAFEEALTELTPHLVLLQDEAVIPEPWMGDATSASAHRDYQQRVVEAVDGPLAAMRAYEVELNRILESLKAMEDHYARTDGTIAGDLGRRA